MSDSYFLTVDAGTTGTKVAAIDRSGRTLAHAYRDYPCQHPRPGWVEQDVDVMFNAELAAIGEVVAGVGPDTAYAIACSAQRATWVPLDGEGTALTPYIGWQDSRGLADHDQIRQDYGADYVERTGMSLDPVSSLSKIAWLVRERPDLADSTACFGAHQTLLLRQLGVDKFLVSASEASYMGLLNVHHRDWDTDLAADLSIDVDKLPRIVESGTRVGQLSAAVAARTGLPAGLPIVMGGGDLQLGVLGVGAAEPGRVAVGIGTGGGSVASFEKPRPDASGRLNCLAHVVPGWWEVEGLGAAAGASFRWFKDAFGQGESARAGAENLDVYDLLTEQVPAEPSGLLAIPALAGLAAPHNDPRFSGAVLGLRLDHQRGDVIRAFLEGITLEQRSILETMTETAGPVDEVRAWGGAAKSDVWCQIQADVYGLPVSRCREPDASTLGAAICAAAGVGVVPSVRDGMTEMTSVARTWKPREATALTYDRYYDVYLRAIRGFQSTELSDALFALR